MVEVLSDGSIRTLEGNTPGDARELDGVFVKVRPRELCDTFIRIPGEVPDGIGRGDHGGEVRDLQKQLVEAREQEARGRRRLRREDREGRRAFQRKHDLPETGVANSKTLTAIAKALEPAKPEPEPEPARAAKPKHGVRRHRGLSNGRSRRRSTGLTTRTALNKQVSAFLNDGARFVQISPES